MLEGGGFPGPQCWKCQFLCNVVEGVLFRGAGSETGVGLAFRWATHGVVPASGLRSDMDDGGTAVGTSRRRRGAIGGRTAGPRV